ncbi:IS1400 transposase A [Yersinia pseudotuberculosis]|nr:IS1400 transposase A [Yersinia pseudotuberculosis]CNK54518.1 IS1400 transposase A [Yersinia pseudotuberculosis]
MRKIRFTEHQIIAVLKSVEAGRTVKDVCPEAAISEASYYNWKAKYGGSLHYGAHYQFVGWVVLPLLRKRPRNLFVHRRGLANLLL